MVVAIASSLRAAMSTVVGTSWDNYMVRSTVRGINIIIWNATVGQRLHCQQEVGNPHDPYAVAVLETGVTVGHVPREILAVCSTFLGRQGRIICEVTATKRYSADLYLRASLTL